MMNRRKAVIATIAMLAAISSGAMAKDKVVVPTTLDFAKVPAYRVDVTSLDVVIAAEPPQEYPLVGHLAPVTYSQAVRDWAAHRFDMTGNTVNKLRVTLNEGRIVETILPIKKGIRGWFKKEQAVQYDATLSVEVAVIDAVGTVLASASARAVQAQTLTEGATPDDKRAAWMHMIQATFDGIDAGIDEQVRINLSQFVR
ncbi:MAG: hypothetical protein KDE14_05925 [Rhodobacteraceae bacterium]|nr:hypothetical protein [Paracoccaceae bacterium]